ncbi:MAG: chromosome segregation protein SMC [Candidatus Zixiibacteriota bacterium]
MYLKKLDIVGFKSFANKTTIHFSPGITAIVGPNGCGKTNILDALRWVLGEQKVTMLRGSKMEEVIFNGTREIKPLGMSEVTISLVNNRGVLPTEYTEVQITRRLFRSGESEYLLNKVPCRLKDITELFYDTGVGAHSYSVIQQDMIEAVISDKAEERRFLFEEAAGITKYKQRKRAALRKLEATENDFLRLNDICSEVKTQVNSLRRQQKKAERYQQIADEIKAWELYLSSNRVRNIDREIRELKARRDQLNNQLVEKSTATDSLSSNLEGHRRQQIDIEHELTKVGNEIYEISDRAHNLEKDISVHREKKSNARLLIERNHNEITALEKRAELLVEQQREAEALLVSQKQDLGAIETELKQAEAAQADADSKLLSARSGKERENELLIQLEGQLSSGKTEDDTLRTQIEELTDSVAATEESLKQANVERESVVRRVAAQQSAVAEIEEQRRLREQENSQLGEKLKNLLEQTEEHSAEISNLQASIEACQARKNLLEEMMLHYEGYESGVKAAMDERSRWPGIYGTVAEKFVPVEGLEIAVEAALGEMARFLICDKRATGESIINYLKSANKGRIGVLVPDSGTITPAVKRPELEMPEFIGWLDNLVTTEDHLRPLMQAVLARTAVFKAGFNPDEILRRLPYGFQAVSDRGDVYSKNIISGGSHEQLQLFRRREKVSEQEQMIVQLEQSLNELSLKKNRTTAEIAQVRSDLSKLADQLDSLGEDIESARSQLHELEYELRSLDTEKARLDKEKKGLADKLDKIAHRQYTLGLDFNQLTSRRKELAASIAESSQRLSELEKEANVAQQRLASLQVKQVESRSRIDQTESKQKHLAELQDNITSTIEIKTQEIENAKQQIVTSDESIGRLETELKQTFEKRQEANSRQTELRASQGEILDKVSVIESQIKQVRSERETISEEMHRLDIRLNTIEAELGSIGERIREEYDVDIKAVDAPSPDETVPEEEARKLLTERKERLKSFGAVNLLALEEYKTASERKDFLEAQLSDLSTAKEDLHSTITKINQTARQLFLDTFNQVRLNFKSLFVELFTGGEADIFLRDPSDPLESDIEIIARPRGKKLLAITMMSGGERALTAISLLFSLYLVKPSPFCILDEIDAPLDDANCHRFLRIIRKFSEQTQFIIITHNKISMEAANNLYGVTMEQFGVSKIVAVKFTDGDEAESSADIVATDEEVEVDADSEPGNGHSKAIQPETAPDNLEDVPQRVIERLNRPIGTPSSSEDQQD